MPIEVAPNLIELTSLSGGYQPDAAEAAVPMDGSPAVSNLLPMPWGNELRLRNGFTRETSGRATSLAGTHWARHVWYYELIDSGARKRYLMVLMTTGVNNVANNVQLWAYDLINNTFTRVDTAAVAWAKASVEFWAATVEGTFFMGTRGTAPVAWHPTNGYDSTPTTPTADTWVDSITPAASQVARDYAFKRGTVVLYSAKYYRAARGIRYKTWESGQGYTKGERVSRKAAVGGQTYWRSYECISSHTAASANAPGTGADTDTYWKKRRLSNILDDDNELTDDWFLNPIPRKASVGAYHGNRLWVRADDNDNWARVQYSAPAKPERDADIADLDFDPTDWAAVDDNDGDGGGWMTIPFSGKGDAIRALYSFGNYLIIAGRWQTYVLSGLNESTWTLRKLGNYGAASLSCVTELEGLVYMLGRHGILTVTDGTTMQPVPGMEKIRKWLKDKLDDVLSASTPTSGANWFPNLTSHDGFLFISLPNESNPSASSTLVYDPRTQSFWELDIPILDFTTGEDGGVERLWFTAPITKLTTQTPTIFRYLDDPGNEVYTDDDWQALTGTAATSDISWNWRSAWFQFGTRRNERRLRRAWGLVGGEAASTVVVRLFRNFVAGGSSYLTTVTRTLTGQATQEAEYVEANVGQGSGTAYAVGIRLSGTANAPLSVHGVGIDTEPVRSGRFHK